MKKIDLIRVGFIATQADRLLAEASHLWTEASRLWTEAKRLCGSYLVYDTLRESIHEI